MCQSGAAHFFTKTCSLSPEETFCTGLCRCHEIRIFLHGFAIIQLLLGFISGFIAYLTEAGHRCCCSTLKGFLLLYNPSACYLQPISPLPFQGAPRSLHKALFPSPPFPPSHMLPLRSLTFFVDVAASQESYLTKRKLLFSGLTKLNVLRLN